jgi:hypothetical protein
MPKKKEVFLSGVICLPDDKRAGGGGEEHFLWFWGAGGLLGSPVLGPKASGNGMKFLQNRCQNGNEMKFLQKAFPFSEEFPEIA